MPLTSCTQKEIGGQLPNIFMRNLTSIQNLNRNLSGHSDSACFFCFFCGHFICLSENDAKWGVGMPREVQYLQKPVFMPLFFSRKKEQSGKQDCLKIRHAYFYCFLHFAESFLTACHFTSLNLIVSTSGFFDWEFFNYVPKRRWVLLTVCLGVRVPNASKEEQCSDKSRHLDWLPNFLPCKDKWWYLIQWTMTEWIRRDIFGGEKFQNVQEKNMLSDAQGPCCMTTCAHRGLANEGRPFTWWNLQSTVRAENCSILSQFFCWCVANVLSFPMNCFRKFLNRRKAAVLEGGSTQIPHIHSNWYQTGKIHVKITCCISQDTTNETSFIIDVRNPLLPLVVDCRGRGSHLSHFLPNNYKRTSSFQSAARYETGLYRRFAGN